MYLYQYTIYEKNGSGHSIGICSHSLISETIFNELIHKCEKNLNIEELHSMSLCTKISKRMVNNYGFYHINFNGSAADMEFGHEYVKHK